MCELESEELLSDDSLLPSCQNQELGRCSVCPAFMFLSNTEKKRHISVFHRHFSPSTAKSKPLIYSCTCVLKFTSTYQLRKHKMSARHTRERKGHFLKHYKETLCTVKTDSDNNDSKFKCEQSCWRERAVQLHKIKKSDEVSEKSESVKVMSLRVKSEEWWWRVQVTVRLMIRVRWKKCVLSEWERKIIVELKLGCFVTIIATGYMRNAYQKITYMK